MKEPKTEQLEPIMDELTDQDMALAFSGGVDSSLLLKMAADRAAKKGTKVWAVTFNSRLHPSCDLENARKVAEELGGIHVILEIDELEMEEIRSNPVNRCYLCKRNLFRTLMAFAKEKGVEVLAEGTNEDDLHVYRPGIQAVRELGIRSPLAEAGLTKEEVRRRSREAGLFTWNKPAYACLATRIPTGTPIARRDLERVEAAESALTGLGFSDFRVRLFHGAARIQITEEQVSRALELRPQLLAACGREFDGVLLDLAPRAAST